MLRNKPFQQRVLQFNVGYSGGRSFIRSIIASGIANVSLLEGATSLCFNFAEQPIAVYLELQKVSRESSLNFTLPSAVRVVEATDLVRCTVDRLLTPKFSTAAQPSISVAIFNSNLIKVAHLAGAH
jgi:hypothetical protein